MSIKNILLRQKNNKNPAIVYGRETISYFSLYELVKKHSNNFGQEQILFRNMGIFLPNSLNYVIAYFLIAFLNKVIVPININMKADEITNHIEYCELKFIITDSRTLVLNKTKMEDFKCKIRVYLIDTMSFEDIGGEEEVFITENTNDINDTALMLHTSGSLSKPKIVMLTGQNLLACSKSIIKSLRINTADKTLIALPLFLASANTSQLLAHMYAGAEIIIMDAVFTAKYFFRLVEKHCITNFTGVPYMMNLILESEYKTKFDLSSLRFICYGGAPTPVKKIIELTNTFSGIDFIHMYGQTEASTRITHLLPPDSFTKVGSVGKSIPGVEIRLVDHNGSDVDGGEIGEIIVRGENVMKGYYKRNEETNKTIKNGWLYTGDLGRLDKDKFLYITGRMRNVIIKGGMNIYPEEVEEVLLRHPKVKDACIIGKRDDLLGEVPVAYIVKKNDCDDISSEELINYCCVCLTNYKIPYEILFTKEIPKTASGKIKRDLL